MGRTLESSLQNFGSQYVFGEPSAYRFFGTQQPHRTERALDQGQIMHRRKNSDALVAQGTDEVYHFHLTADVQMLRGFIEKQQSWSLGQTKSYLDTLALASAELVENARAKRLCIG